MIEVIPLALDGVLEIRPCRSQDERGFFSETWNLARWTEVGIGTQFVQDNHSWSRDKGVMRGLHFQAPPCAQAKLVRVSRGAVFDVAVDIRPSSPNYGKWVSAILSAERWNQLLVPEGFAHGFVTLEADTEVLYKTSAPYSAEHDRAIRFDDPDIGIEWPFASHQMIMSDKDRRAGRLSEMLPRFRFA